jgi:hypothetical protein
MKWVDRALKKVIRYGEKVGFKEIEFDGKTGESWIEWKEGSNNKPHIISIERTKNKENQLYFLLHELGHHELRKDWDYYRERFPRLAESEQDLVCYRKLRRRLGYKIEILDEEYEAWGEGLLIAERLNIGIKFGNYMKLRDKSLMSYIRYFGRQ